VSTSPFHPTTVRGMKDVTISAASEYATENDIVFVGPTHPSSDNIELINSQNGRGSPLVIKYALPAHGAPGTNRRRASK
jgi:hypothetical protein